MNLQYGDVSDIERPKESAQSILNLDEVDNFKDLDTFPPL